MPRSGADSLLLFKGSFAPVVESAIRSPRNSPRSEIKDVFPLPDTPAKQRHHRRPSRAQSIFCLFIIAAAIAVLHIATNNRYGFHRDELQFLSDARHLDWGYVSYPPFTPFVEHIGLRPLRAFHGRLALFSVIAQAAVVYVSGLMARELGGGRWPGNCGAHGRALTAATLSGTEFQYTSFDFSGGS